MSNYYDKVRKRAKSKKNRNRRLKFLIPTILFFILAVIISFYVIIYKSNVWTGNQKSFALKIDDKDDWESIKKQLYNSGVIENRISFEILAKALNYPKKIKPGHYILTKKMNNKDIMSKLIGGRQDPVKLIFNNIRTKNDFAQSISNQLRIDSLSIIQKLNDNDFLSQFDLDSETALCLFIPNTYEFYWNTSIDKFFERMNKENNLFWNESRQKKLANNNFTKKQVYILASIVEKETNKDSEKADIAGVYLNRLKIGWRLQADPTLVFALGDFSIKRVLNEFKNIDSPYNTYKYSGLPPGPICIPEISSIDAVLNFTNHNYLFFCAREDFSGYHNFATNMDEHIINANKYRRALDSKGINN